MDKKTFLSQLSNIKVIIGNGFDLHCGLHTRYEDFYIKNYEKYDLLDRWLSTFQKTKEFRIDKYFNRIEDINIWDVFFNFSTNNDTQNPEWWSVEGLLLSSLLTENDVKNHPSKYSLLLKTSIRWYKFKDYYQTNTVPTNDLDAFFVLFINTRNAIKHKQDLSFYEFLLDELNDFESNFGSFIHWQLHDEYMEKQNYALYLNTKYLNNCISTLKFFGGLENIVSIDSFNYGEMCEEKLSTRLHHINGNYKAPIFGVDSSYFEPGDERFIFTKTGRRIEADIFDTDANEIKDFENIVVYGHSLNEADYNYFFPIFDKINLLDSQAKGMLIFAFSVFENADKRDVKINLRNSVSKILIEYAESKGIKSPKRFLDGLTTQHKLMIFEIPLLEPSYENFLDDNWKQVLEDYKRKKYSRYRKNRTD